MNPSLSLFFLTPPLHCYQRETESIRCHKSSCQTRRSTFQIESEASPNAYRWCLWCQLCWNSLPVLETSPSCSPLLALSLCAVISEAGIYLFFVYLHLSLMVVLRFKTKKQNYVSSFDGGVGCRHFSCNGFLASSQEYFVEVVILSHGFLWDYAQV